MFPGPGRYICCLWIVFRDLCLGCPRVSGINHPLWAPDVSSFLLLRSPFPFRFLPFLPSIAAPVLPPQLPPWTPLRALNFLALPSAAVSGGGITTMDRRSFNSASSPALRRVHVSGGESGSSSPSSCCRPPIAPTMVVVKVSQSLISFAIAVIPLGF
ncbi:hypothetical protein PVAP13_5KG039801 [Panicum virgatum]|uniref:Uncharacterized protein n=1 Tax=Panicum virgatum TaxID=38727 RepID=A0A8T0SBT8_PANVG|nr:hypothetical protein PVAP13_5KG039801 [Panicum virgatum]